MQSVNGDRGHRGLYIETKYELKGYCALEKVRNRNPVSRLLNVVIEGINTRDHLPNYLVLIIDDSLVVHADIGDYIMKWLLIEITKAFLTRRDMIWPKCKPELVPTILIIKPVPKPLWFDMTKQYTKDKRKLMSHIKASVKSFTNMRALNMDRILSTDHNLFDNTGCVPGFRFAEFWSNLDEEIKYMDEEKSSVAYQHSSRGQNPNRSTHNDQRHTGQPYPRPPCSKQLTS